MKVKNISREFKNNSIRQFMGKNENTFVNQIVSDVMLSVTSKIPIIINNAPAILSTHTTTFPAFLIAAITSLIASAEIKNGIHNPKE